MYCNRKRTGAYSQLTMLSNASTDTVKAVLVRLPADVHQRLAEKCRKRNVSVNSVLRRLIERYIERRPR